MARPVRGCPMPQPQQGGTDEPKSNSNIPQQGGHADAMGDEVIADFDLDVDYKPEGSGPEIKAVNKDEENSDAEYAKMELP